MTLERENCWILFWRYFQPFGQFDRMTVKLLRSRIRVGSILRVCISQIFLAIENVNRVIKL